MSCTKRPEPSSTPPDRVDAGDSAGAASACSDAAGASSRPAAARLWARGVVQGGWAAVFMLSWIVGGIVSSVTVSPWPELISIPANLKVLGAFIFGEPSSSLVPETGRPPEITTSFSTPVHTTMSDTGQPSVR